MISFCLLVLLGFLSEWGIEGYREGDPTILMPALSVLVFLALWLYP